MFCIFCILYIFTCCADHLKPGSDAYFTYFAYFAYFTYFTLCCASRCVPAQRSVAIDVRMCGSSRKSFGKSFGKSFEKSFVESFGNSCWSSFQKSSRVYL